MTIKVLMVVDQIGTNGTFTHILSISKELKTIGVAVVITARPGSMNERLIETDIPYYEVNFPNAFTNDRDKYPDVYDKLREIIRLEKITVIHGHQAYSSYFVSKLALTENIPYINTIHGLYNKRDELTKIVMNSNDVIAVSPLVYEYLMSHTQKKPIFIPNGIDLNEFKTVQTDHLRKQLNIPNDAFVILYASRLDWKKADICMMILQKMNQTNLIKMHNIHFIIAGEGKRSKQIKNFAAFINKKQPNNYIHFVGNQTYLNEYFSLADCIIGTGRTALEGIACERLVIAVGIKGYLGLVTENNWNQARYGHFGDHAAPTTINLPALQKDILDAINNKANGFSGLKLKELLLRDFNLQESVQRLKELYLNYL